MPLLKTPKTSAVTPESISTMRRLSDDPRLADDVATQEQLLEQREGLLLAMRQRKAAFLDEQEAQQGELREMGLEVDDTAAPDPMNDPALLALQKQLAPVEAELVTTKRRIDTMAQLVRDEVLQAGATAQLQDIEAILALLRPAIDKAQMAAARSQKCYGLVQDFLGPIRLLTGLATYDVRQWEDDMPRLRRLAEGKHRA